MSKKQQQASRGKLEEMKEESKVKQPVGMRTDSKKKTNPQKLLIVADEKASFFNLASENNSQSTLLVEDATYP